MGIGEEKVEGVEEVEEVEGIEVNYFDLLYNYQFIDIFYLTLLNIYM